LSGFGTGPYTVTPSKTGDVNGITSFDAARIAQHVVNLISLNSTQLLAADVSANNSVTSFDAALIAQYLVLIPNPGITGTWKFIPVNRSYSNVETNQTGQDYSAILMGEVSGNWIPPSSFAPLANDQSKEKSQLGGTVIVTAPTMTATTGQNFTIQLMTQDTTGQGIISSDFDLVYNPSVITPQASPCDTSGTISTGLLPTCNSPSAGLLKVSLFGSTPIAGAGVLLKLKFTAVGGIGTVSPLTFPAFRFNEGDPMSVVIPGQVTIVAAGPTAANVEVGGMLMTADGNSVKNAIVILTDSAGTDRSVRSNSFGYFHFAEVPVGASYVISVRSKGLTFTPQAIVVNETISSLNLIAEP
jgi:Carboxypeptidase regulatory-like domain/Dockerin type I domain